MHLSLVLSPDVQIIALPSCELVETLQVAEAARVEAQRAALGSAGLQDCAERLALAMAANNVEPPHRVVESVPVPSAAAITMHPVQTWASGQPPHAGVAGLGDIAAFVQVAVSDVSYSRSMTSSASL